MNVTYQNGWAVPAGWKMVPEEPTEEMLAATSWPGCAKTDYRHMLRAAPQPAQQPLSDEHVSVIGMPEFDALIDHIYEHGTTSEGVVILADALARALLSRYGRPAWQAQPVAWVAADTLHSPHPGCVSSLAYMSQLDKDRGREYVPLYAAPVAAQKADDTVIEAWGRAQFEAWYRLHHGSRDVYGRDASGEYADKQVQGAFNVWKARAALIDLADDVRAALAAQPAAHPDDAAVDRFAAAMKAKPAEKATLLRQALEGVCHEGGDDVQLDAVKSTAAIAWGWLRHVTTTDDRVKTARDLLEQMLDKDLRRYGLQTAKTEGAQEIEDEQP